METVSVWLDAMCLCNERIEVSKHGGRFYGFSALSNHPISETANRNYKKTLLRCDFLDFVHFDVTTAWATGGLWHAL